MISSMALLCAKQFCDRPAANGQKYCSAAHSPYAYLRDDGRVNSHKQLSIYDLPQNPKDREPQEKRKYLMGKKSKLLRKIKYAQEILDQMKKEFPEIF